MRLYQKVLAILAITSLASCGAMQTGGSAMSVLNTVAGLTYYYDNGDVVSFLAQAPLTEKEVEEVKRALDLVKNARDRLDHMRSDPALFAASLNMITIEYMRIKLAYANVRGIAIKYESHYLPEAWAAMELFDILAHELDVKFADFISDAKTNEAVTNAIMMAGTVVRMAAIL